MVTYFRVLYYMYAVYCVYCVHTISAELGCHLKYAIDIPQVRKSPGEGSTAVDLLSIRGPGQLRRIRRSPCKLRTRRKSMTEGRRKIQNCVARHCYTLPRCGERPPRNRLYICFVATQMMHCLCFSFPAVNRVAFWLHCRDFWHEYGLSAHIS